MVHCVLHFTLILRLRCWIAFQNLAEFQIVWFSPVAVLGYDNWGGRVNKRKRRNRSRRKDLIVYIILFIIHKKLHFVAATDTVVTEVRLTPISGPFCMLVYSCLSFSFFCCALFYFSYLSVHSEKRFWFSHSKSTGNNTAASATKRPRHTSTACTLNVAECPSRSAAGKQINSKTKARLTGGHHLIGGMLPPLLLLLKPLLLATEQTSFVPRLCWATLLRILLNKAVYSRN